MLWTWLFNNTRGSILFAILVHSVSNASSSLISSLVRDQGGGSPWLLFIIFGTVAVLLIVATRGRLAYRPETMP